ncbi:MAG TPA: glycosyltransferase family 39 protein, partial [Beijerinckiaceae bacterium]|nr:glycosyltransferase family 39 protein [Beijerinckiaceae bacterium]
MTSRIDSWASHRVIDAAPAAQAAPARSGLIRDRFDALALVLIVGHGLYWTLMPALTTGTFALDTGEALFWGREWQLGYYKHPPLMAWLAESGVAVFGRSLVAVYLVPQLCVAAAFAAMWWLARRLVSSAGALLALAALMLVLPFTVGSPTFNANIALLPFWAWTIAFAWDALERNEAWRWLRLGLVVGLGFLAKYAILILCAAIALYCLRTPSRRWVLRARGPWLAVAAAVLVASPHLYWLLREDELPLAYATASKAVTAISEALPQFGLFVAHQGLIYLPLLVVAALWAIASGRRIGVVRVSRDGVDRQPLRFLLFAGFAPVVVTVAAALATRQKPPMSWGDCFPIVAGLLACLAWPWLARDLAEGRAPRAAPGAFAALVLALWAAPPVRLLAWAGVGLAPPKTAFDGAAHGAILDAFWAQRRQQPLRYQVSHFGDADDRALGSSTAFF